ncbi:hypothetical protein [Radicibacter daui]|uniref:hypothetical protein n=1 Tax=Radicibacter daui TaxID=3064829 RepID=UPI0040469194
MTSIVRVEIASEFKGAAVVLLAMNANGLTAFMSAIANVIRPTDREALQVEISGVSHVIAVKNDKADVELRPGKVTWCFSAAKLGEIFEKLETMKGAPGPCHHFVDITSPAETLILSRDEYV